MKPKSHPRAEVEERGQREDEGQGEEMGQNGNRDRRRAETSGGEYRVPDKDHKHHDDHGLERHRHRYDTPPSVGRAWRVSRTTATPGATLPAEVSSASWTSRPSAVTRSRRPSHRLCHVRPVAYTPSRMRADQ